MCLSDVNYALPRIGVGQTAKYNIRRKPYTVIENVLKRGPWFIRGRYSHATSRRRKTSVTSVRRTAAQLVGLVPKTIHKTIVPSIKNHDDRSYISKTDTKPQCRPSRALLDKSNCQTPELPTRVGANRIIIWRVLRFYVGCNLIYVHWNR